ncbi:hypothetical protein K8R61_00685 [bacterium]|nr:hypothetical protein [bacterium]
MNRKIILLFIAVVLVILIIITCYIINPELDCNPNTEEAAQVVITYMNYTLGTLPNSNVDYDKAKKFLAHNLVVEFGNPMFVPVSYCIQDGPDNVRIFSSEYNKEMNWAEIVVESEYGNEWNQMWKFFVVQVESDDWMINKIQCL